MVKQNGELDMSLDVERNRIVGKANMVYNACMSADLGSALGRVVGSDNVVVTGRDGKGFSRLMKRALTCGIMENGIQVLDARLVPAPVMRYCIVESRSDYGVYMGFYWRDQTKLATTFFDRNGSVLDEEMLHKILDSQGDCTKSISAREVGDIIFYAEAKASYSSHVLDSIDTDSISGRKPKVILDCSNGAVSVTLPKILRDLGCNVVSTHDAPSAYMTHKPVMSKDSLMSEFAQEIAEEHADLGIVLDPCGESVRFADDSGELISQTDLAILLSKNMGLRTMLVHEGMDLDALTRAGVKTDLLKPEHDKILPEGVDMAFGEDETCYLGDAVRRWWDAVPVSLKAVELLCKSGKISLLR
jgi:phosphomannomutase/phosphoglucomutase